MPKKKKSGKKKNDDPGAGGDGGKKKKKKKTDKQKAKLEKEADKLRNSGAPFKEMIHKMEMWLKIHSEDLITFCKQIDELQEGLLSYEEFKSGLFDLEAPLNKIEQHLLCQLLDLDSTGEIDYRSLVDGLAITRDQEQAYEIEDVRPKIIVTQRGLPHCTCKLVLWDAEYAKQDFPRYLKINLKLVTFENFKNHPGHIRKRLVPTHTLVSTLIEMIRQETNLQAVKEAISIYTDNTRELKSLLPAPYSLEECGFKGGTFDFPTRLDLFYDYKTENYDCPLLLCDHYFVKEK